MGLTVSSDGLQLNQDKVQELANFQRPESVNELRTFLGFAGFLRHFIKNFSIKVATLCDLLKKKPAFS